MPVQFALEIRNRLHPIIGYKAEAVYFILKRMCPDIIALNRVGTKPR